jgi:hypothetical protein
VGYNMIDMRKNAARFALAALALCLSVGTLAKGQAPLKDDPNQPPLSDASGEGALTAFERFSQYPPDSRPLNTWNWDLIHPWSTDTSPAPMIPTRVVSQARALRASGVPEDEAWRSAMPASLPQYQFELNKTILAGTDDELRARLRVTAGPGSDTPVHFQVAKAELIGDQDFGSPHLGSVPFSCDPAESACTFRWHAPSADRQNWGILELQVTVTVDGMQDDFIVSQSFYSSPMVAGKFTGAFRERLVNGSLVIDAGVSVQKRMACFLSANLFSADKELPTHHVERRLIVDPSMKTVSFTFFGKIFRDFGHEGTFRLQDLKGQCENLAYPPEWFIDSQTYQAELLEFANNPPPTREPGRIYFAYTQLTYVTNRYRNSTFSDREWTSPERQSKVELLKKAAADLNSPALEERKRRQQPQ